MSREESAEGPRGKDLVSLIGAHFKSWIILRFVSKAGTGRECKTQKTIKSQLKSLTFYTFSVMRYAWRAFCEGRNYTGCNPFTFFFLTTIQTTYIQIENERKGGKVGVGPALPLQSHAHTGRHCAAAETLSGYICAASVWRLGVLQSFRVRSRSADAEPTAILRRSEPTAILRRSESTAVLRRSEPGSRTHNV